LDASLLCDADVTNPSVDDLISAKFYYAGGSARLMFCYNTATVIRLIAEMLSRTCQKQEYIITNIADRTNQTTNGLLNSYVSSSGVRYNSLLSSYVCTEIVKDGGPSFVESLARALGVSKHPALDGWLFERWFFSHLKFAGLKVESLTGQRFEWPQPKKDFETTVPAEARIFTSLDDIWTQPRGWNQPGYDAVLIKPKEKIIEFFQVTRGASHSLLLRHFAAFLEHLNPKQRFNIFIYLVVPLNNLKTFKLGTVEDQNAFKKFKRNWSVENSVRIVGLQKYIL
jgi:hypothetical protein